MTSPSYDSIAPLICSQDQKGSTLSVGFRCPTTGVEVMGRARLKKSTSVAATAERSAKKNLWGGLQRSVTRMVSSSIGGGVAGRFAKDVVGSALKSAGPASDFSESELRTAILEAFESVRTKFRWDDAGACWVGASAAE